MGEVVIFIFVIGIVWSFISSVRSYVEKNENEDSNANTENVGGISDTGTGNAGGTSNTGMGNRGEDNKKHINTVAEQREFLQKRYGGQLFLARSAEVHKNIEENCPYDGDILFKHDAIISTALGTKQVLRNAKCCDACNRAFVITLNNGGEKFYVQKNKLYINKRIHDCQRNGHMVVSVTGVVKNIDGKELNINVQYCAVCRRYFIEKEQFDRYKALYGIMLGNFVYCDGWNNGYAPLMNQYFLLNLCGYNVGQKDNLSPRVRQEILRYIIENKLMSKPDIIKHLDYYINLNNSQSSKRLAVKKWKEDLDYVNNLEIDKQRKIKF